MTGLELYKFIKEYDCEYHWYDNNGEDDVMLFISVSFVDEFNKLFDSSFYDEGFECVMKEHYLCFWMKEACDYYEINIKEIFERKE